MSEDRRPPLPCKDRLILSALSLIGGYLVAVLAIFVLSLIGDPISASQTAGFAFGMAEFVALGWLAIVAPLVAFTPWRWPIFRLPWAVPFGAVVGSGIYFAVFQLYLGGWAIGCAATIGAVGAGLYAAGLRSRRVTFSGGDGYIVF